MESSSTDTGDLVRGLLIALGLIALSSGAFLVVAHNGHSHGPDIIDRVMTMMAPAPPKPEKKKVPPVAAVERQANPSASGGATGAGAGAGDGGGASSPQGGGTPTEGASGMRPVAHTAAQALRQALQDYRADPARTATVTISSTGRISETKPGPLTGHDGLPMSALNGSIVLTGGAPAATR